MSHFSIGFYTTKVNRTEIALMLLLILLIVISDAYFLSSLMKRKYIRLQTNQSEDECKDDCEDDGEHDGEGDDEDDGNGDDKDDGEDDDDVPAGARARRSGRSE